MAVGPGVRPAQVLTLDVTLPTRRYPTKESRAAFFRALMARLAAVPGVTAVGANRYFPLRDRQYSNPVFVEGRAAAAGAEPIVQYGGITDGYLDAMGIRVVDGRGFTAAETWETPGAVLVSEQMAREHWPGVRAVGRRLRIGPGLPWLTVVGVVADVRQRELDAPAAPQLYVPYSDFQHSTMTVAVRTAGDAARRLPDVVRALRALDPLLPPFNVATLDELMARSQPGRRVATDVLGGFGVLALGLALVGVASAMSYTVAQSTREIGVRMALGARRWDVVRLVLAQGGRVAGAGIVAGLAIALGAARLLRGLLFGVSAADPGTLAAVAAAVAVTVLGACVVPAWRAARADPLAALRADGA
jgi:putative ABC transport system permease protein